MSASTFFKRQHHPQSLARKLCAGIFTPNVSAALWRETFAYLARLPASAVSDRSAVAALFVHQMAEWRTWLKDDALLLQAMRTLLPPEQTDAVTVYRGESWFLFDAGDIGFCWSSDQAVATRYAQGINAVESGGVLLKGYAPASAILAVVPGAAQHAPVYLCDPSQMTGLTTLALYPQS